MFQMRGFFVTEKEEKIHNFLNHYEQGGSLPTEFKPMKKVRYDASLEKYSININEHARYYTLRMQQNL